MMKWLDALGWFTWPSLALIAAPIAAYPFWLPAPAPAAYCGLVAVGVQTFRAFRTADGGGHILRPTSPVATARIVSVTVEPTGVDAGGMVVEAGSAALDRLACNVSLTEI